MEVEGVKIEKVYYKHYRHVERQDGYWKYEIYPYSRGKTNWTPACQGGLTACTILDENGNEFHAKSECSLKDNFVYAIGRKIAYGRALKKMQQYYSELQF